MMHPVTCLSLLAALGAGLYLYQEKHTAQLLDRDINRTVKQAEVSRDRIGMLKAEWALLNEPERLQGLAAQHLQLQSLAPVQFARLEDLPGRLPAPSAMPVVTPADDAPVAAIQAPSLPTAQATPVLTPLPAPALPRVAAAPRLPVPAAVAQMPPAPLAGLRLATAPAPVVPVPVAVQQATAKPLPKPASPRVLVAAKPAQDPAPIAAPAPRPFYAPVMPAYAPTPVLIHAPSVQPASATEMRPAPFVGSALGMARSTLAAPVPVAASYSAR